MQSSLKKMPKIELHEHLDGSLRVPTIVELARQDSVRLPESDPAALRRILVPGPSSLEEYLKAFAVTVSVMQTPQALRRVAREMVEDWHADSVVYGEVRFAPELHTQKGLSLNSVVEAVLQGLEDGHKVTGLETGLILVAMRPTPPNLQTVKLVNEYRNHGVVAYDIAGAEAPFRPALFRESYEYAAEHFLNTTCHAGEVTSPGFIREALLACRSLRIGHGTQLFQEWTGGEFPPAGSLSSWMRDRKIPLEMCIRSNIQTRAVASAESHPFGSFLREGLSVCVCTDNRLVSDTDLTKEYELARDTWMLTDAELFTLQKNALDAAFCSHETRRRLLAKYFS